MNALFGPPEDAPRLPWGVRPSPCFGPLSQAISCNRTTASASCRALTRASDPRIRRTSVEDASRAARDFRGSRSRGDRACTASSGEQSRRGFVWLSLRPQGRGDQAACCSSPIPPLPRRAGEPGCLLFRLALVAPGGRLSDNPTALASRRMRQRGSDRAACRCERASRMGSSSLSGRRSRCGADPRAAVCPRGRVDATARGRLAVGFPTLHARLNRAASRLIGRLSTSLRRPAVRRRLLTAVQGHTARERS